jgi:hypothetical protein
MRRGNGVSNASHGATTSNGSDRPQGETTIWSLHAVKGAKQPLSAGLGVHVVMSSCLGVHVVRVLVFVFLSSWCSF